MKINLKRSAFTLAETLIVIGIIGVIASLTIPTLSNETNSKETVTKLKKTQAILEDAYGRAEAQYGSLDDWTTLNTATFTQRMTGTMKLNKVCKLTEADSSCFAPAAKYMKVDGSITTAANATTLGKVVLADDSVVGFNIEQGSSKDCNTDVTSNNASLPDLQKVCGTITVDINGSSKGKSIWGRDMFAFYITRHGLYPVGMDGDTKADFTSKCLANISAGTDGSGCTAWVVTNGNMDYTDAKADGTCLKGNTSAKLGWANQTSCR